MRGGAANARALDLRVEPNRAPMLVNSDRMVNNLYADELDGKDSSQLLGGTITVQRTDVAVADGQTVNAFAGCATGERIIGGSANLDAVTSDSVVNVARPSKDDVGTGAVPGEGETFSFWKGTATNAAAGDTATRTDARLRHLRALSGGRDPVSATACCAL